VASARQALGAFGEEQTARWYAARGYRVLDRNWRAGRHGEIDLILGAPGVVVFCEVKSRSSAAFGQPFEAVTPAKQARIRRVATAWLAAHPAGERRDVRFDVASVLHGKVAVIEAAF
jgi:putative endonuclease